MPAATARRLAPVRAATPMAFARYIVAAYRRYGRSPERALRLAQITPGRLQLPQARITARQMEVLSAAAMQELDDEALGVFSRRLRQIKASRQRRFRLWGRRVTTDSWSRASRRPERI